MEAPRQALRSPGQRCHGRGRQEIDQARAAQQEQKPPVPPPVEDGRGDDEQHPASPAAGGRHQPPHEEEEHSKDDEYERVEEHFATPSCRSAAVRRPPAPGVHLRSSAVRRPLLYPSSFGNPHEEGTLAAATAPSPAGISAGRGCIQPDSTRPSWMEGRSAKRKLSQLSGSTQAKVIPQSAHIGRETCQIRTRERSIVACSR